MSNLRQSEILSVHHWTDRLFSFTATRDQGFRFISGQFVMIGLAVGGKPLLRAYSVVSPNYAETLEFLSIKVPDGPLTSRLRLRGIAFGILGHWAWVLPDAAVMDSTTGGRKPAL